jgi:molybdate transport system ATP-binding protein
MATLSVEVTLPLRSFRLELELEVAGTVALVGPSGAGKSTVLRAIAGLTRPERGRISLGDDVWLDTAQGILQPPHERSVGFVFQEYALFPHLTVRQNVAYGGKKRAESMLERLGIRHLAKTRPHELSGGERQRVALARALARDPGVLLLDEPLSALDAHTKSAVRAELLEQLRSLGLPTLLVTHDFEDAATLAGTVGVLVDGSIRQLGTPRELVSRPRDAFVASFTGANLLHGHARRDGDGLTRIELDTGELVFSTDEAEGEVGVVVYPWDVSVARIHGEDSARNVVRGEIGPLVQIGNRVRVGIGPLTAEITTAAAAALELERGGAAFASFKATGTRLVLFSDKS